MNKPSVDATSAAARALGQALEPVIGSVYFAPECHEGYVRLGFSPSTAFAGHVALPDGPAYFTSRGAALGQVPGELIAAAFAVFNPAAVIPSVDYGWSLTDAATIAAARTDGATAQLGRLLGAAPAGLDQVTAVLERAVDVLRPEGRPLFAGLTALPVPETQLGRMWRLGDCMREFRGDSHTASWIAAGLDAIEIGLLSELYWGLPLHSYVRTRAWSTDQVEAAIERLKSRGLVDNDSFTEAGRQLREGIELRTDAQMLPALAAIGDDLNDVCARMQTWGVTVRAGHGYLAAGAADLARASG